MKRDHLREPPVIQEHHVSLPDQLGRILGADRAHARKITGRGVRVAVIDSGFYPHPFYLARGYRIRHIPTRKERNPNVDEYGHGTAQLASLFAVAPEVEALAIKCMDRDPSYALEKAIALRPDILSCAWGFNIDHDEQGASPRPRPVPSQYVKMQRLIREAHDQGITVVAAGGNGQFAFPGSMPEVIAAGGIYYAPDGKFYPSDISSRFESSFFPGRMVPDLCGIVGDLPHGRLLLVPVPPKAKLARRPGFATTAMGGASDVGSGWAMFSGTSAATAMISGACALLLQYSPKLSPRRIKEILMDGARLLPQSGCRLLDVDGALRSIIG
ncbi:MAG: S8 family serine peptidase [Deltaproteobacteria bacterium]|nr:S8 family serine peptidase [Deltaproteobacteria bacterium]